MAHYNLFLLLMIGAAKLQTCLSRHAQLEDKAIADSGSTRYTIVFDVGASKTKMQIYKINVNASNYSPLDVGDIEQLEPSFSKVKPGIASLAGNTVAVEEYLMPLLKSAIKTVPEHKHNSTPIFFLATGGMRRLRKDQANAILDKAKKLFTDKNKCPFKFDPKDAKIISGEFEGVYSWITVNFLKGLFRSGTPHPTYGILDLGGASHANTFESTGNDSVSLTIGDKTNCLFARSYLGYGLDLAYQRYLTIEILAHQSLTNGILESPCHHKGFIQPIPSIKGTNVTVVGKPSVAKCRSIIEKFFFCKTRDCPFYDQPCLRGEFFAFAGIFYTAHDTELLCFHCVKPLSAAMFEKSSREFCSKNYEEVKSNPQAKYECFRSNFIYELLTKGYGLPADKMIQVGNKLEGFDLGWTLGAMLYNTGLL